MCCFLVSLKRKCFDVCFGHFEVTQCITADVQLARAVGTVRKFKGQVNTMFKNIYIISDVIRPFCRNENPHTVFSLMWRMF